MGWCSGTYVFDSIAKEILASSMATYDQEFVISVVAAALEDSDWDCQSDSDVWDNPIVQQVMRERHPGWFEDDRRSPS